MKMQVKLKHGLNGYFGWEIDGDGNSSEQDRIKLLNEVKAMDRLLQQQFPTKLPKETKK